MASNLVVGRSFMAARTWLERKSIFSFIGDFSSKKPVSINTQNQNTVKSSRKLKANAFLKALQDGGVWLSWYFATLNYVILGLS